MAIQITGKYTKGRQYTIELRVILHSEEDHARLTRTMVLLAQLALNAGNDAMGDEAEAVVFSDDYFKGHKDLAKLVAKI